MCGPSASCSMSISKPGIMGVGTTDSTTSTAAGCTLNLVLGAASGAEPGAGYAIVAGSVANGGTGYVVGDVLKVLGGGNGAGEFTVTTVGSNGAVTGIGTNGPCTAANANGLVTAGGANYGIGSNQINGYMPALSATITSGAVACAVTTAGALAGLWGPYDHSATDGRALPQAFAGIAFQTDKWAGSYSSSRANLIANPVAGSEPTTSTITPPRGAKRTA